MMADTQRAVGYESVTAVQQERITALTQENVMLAAALREADARIEQLQGAAPDLADVAIPLQREPEPGS